jgi:tetratricopeptide (TPR) repeat protein
LALCQEQSYQDVRENVETLTSTGLALMYVGNYEKAIPYLREAETLAGRAQVVNQQVGALGIQAQCWLRLDRWDEVLATEEKWRELERHYPRERVGPT